MGEGCLFKVKTSSFNHKTVLKIYIIIISSQPRKSPSRPCGIKHNKDSPYTKITTKHTHAKPSII